MTTTNKSVIEMAREAWIEEAKASGTIIEDSFLERFAALVREDEREACAKVCEDYFEFADMNVFDDAIGFAATNAIAAAIRARGETTEEHNKYYYDFDRNK